MHSTFSHQLICLAAFTLPLAAQTTVTVPCAADNTLYESATGALSNGSGTGMFVGLTGTGDKRRAVVRFDIAAALPANAKVLSATLKLNVAQSTVALPMGLTGHRMLGAWGEGVSVAPGNGGGGGASTANDVTWIHGFWPATTWTTPGGDFAATPSMAMLMPPFGQFTSFASIETNADVQDWLNNPTNNFGWLLKTDEAFASTAHRLDTKESIGVKPSLSVTYLLPGQNGTYGTGCPVGAGTFQTAWVGAPIGGNTVAITKTNAPPLSIGADFFALTLDPLGTPLLPGCTLYLPLGQVIPGGAFLTDPAGSGGSSFVVPTGFPGYLIHTQAAVLEANPLGFSIGNAASICLQ